MPSKPTFFMTKISKKYKIITFKKKNIRFLLLNFILRKLYFICLKKEKF